MQTIECMRSTIWSCLFASRGSLNKLFAIFLIYIAGMRSRMLYKYWVIFNVADSIRACMRMFHFRFDWLILNVTLQQNYDTVAAISACIINECGLSFSPAYAAYHTHAYWTVVRFIAGLLCHLHSLLQRIGILSSWVLKVRHTALGSNFLEPKICLQLVAFFIRLMTDIGYGIPPYQLNRVQSNWRYYLATPQSHEYFSVYGWNHSCSSDFCLQFWFSILFVFFFEVEIWRKNMENL